MQKAYRLHPLAILLLNPLYKFRWPFSSLSNQTCNFQFCSSCFFLSFLSPRVTQKLYNVREYYTYQTTALLLEIFLFCVQVVAIKCPPVHKMFSFWHFFGFWVHIPGMVHVQIVRSHLDYWTHVLQSRSSTIILSTYRSIGNLFGLHQDCCNPAGNTIAYTHI